MNSQSSSRRYSPIIRLVLLPLGLMVLSGCVVEERTHVRRSVTVEALPPPPAVAVVEIPAPPPPREEIVVAAPSPSHIWVRGYWEWRGGRHVWLAGHWELPPQPGYVWVEPQWEHRGHGYVFVAGTWRGGPAVVKERVAVQVSPSVHVSLNFIAQPPPPSRREVIVERERPSRDHVWIKGYYVWREGRHVWIEGHWERPPHKRAVWIEPRWEHQAQGYVFIEGRWR